MIAVLFTLACDACGSTDGIDADQALCNTCRTRGLPSLHREALATVKRRGRVSVTEETRRALSYAGAVVDAPHAVGDPLYPEDLTKAGRKVAEEEASKAEARRLRRAATARGRADALRAIGMRRTRYGWE